VTKHYIFGLVTIQGLLLHFVCLAAKKVIARWFFFTFFICLQLCCLPLLFERLSKSHNRDIKRCIFKLGIINYKIKYAFSTLSNSYRTDVPTTWIRDPLTKGIQIPFVYSLSSQLLPLPYSFYAISLSTTVTAKFTIELRYFSTEFKYIFGLVVSSGIKWHRNHGMGT
jgi:hypothetical protein